MRWRMLAEITQALSRLRDSGLYQSRAVYDLAMLHNRYLPELSRIQDSMKYPHVMRILAEEAVEQLLQRMSFLGITGNPSSDTSPPYWRQYVEAVQRGELFGAEYSRFLRAAHLAEGILENSYLQEPSEMGYKEQRYAYALSKEPLPAWFIPETVMQYLEEIITAYGFLWFAVVDYAESRYYEQKGA